MPMSWKSPEGQRKLLLCVLAAFEPAKPNYQKIADMLGQGLTKSAVMQQINALRPEVLKMLDGGEDDAVTDDENARKAPGKKATGVKKGASSKGTGVINGRVEKKPRKSTSSKASRPTANDKKNSWFQGSSDEIQDEDDAGHGVVVDDETLLNSIKSDNAFGLF